MSSTLSHNPLVVLYILQACTYLAAAVISRRAGHRDLTFCYSASALLHGMFGACHFLHFE